MQICIHSRQSTVQTLMFRNIVFYTQRLCYVIIWLILMCASVERASVLQLRDIRHVPPPVSVIQVLPSVHPSLLSPVQTAQCTWGRPSVCPVSLNSICKQCPSVTQCPSKVSLTIQHTKHCCMLQVMCALCKAQQVVLLQLQLLLLLLLLLSITATKS